MIKTIKNSILICCLLLANLSFSEEIKDWSDMYSDKRAYMFDVPLWQKIYNGKFDELDSFLYLRSSTISQSIRIMRDKIPDVIKKRSEKFSEYICKDKKRKKECKELCGGYPCLPVFNSPSPSAKIIGFYDSHHFELFDQKLSPSPLYRKRITNDIDRVFFIINKVEHKVYQGKVYEWAKLQTGPSNVEAWIRTIDLPIADAPKDAKDGDTIPVDFKRSLVSSLKHTDSSSQLCVQDIKDGVVSFHALLPNIVGGIPYARVESDLYFEKWFSSKSNEFGDYIKKLIENRDNGVIEAEKYLSLDKMWVDFIKETESLEPHLFKMKMSEFYAYYLHDYKNPDYIQLFDINQGLSVLGNKGCDKFHKFLFKKFDDISLKKAHLYKYYPIYIDQDLGKTEYPAKLIDPNGNSKYKGYIMRMFNDFGDKKLDDKTLNLPSTYYKGNIMLPYIYPDLKYPETIIFKEPIAR